MVELTSKILIGSFFVAMAVASDSYEEGQRRIDLTQAVRDSSNAFGVPSFHTALVARSTDISGRFYSGKGEPEWTDFGTSKLLRVKGESISELLKLGWRNVEILKKTLANRERLRGAVILDASGLDGKYFAQQFGRTCEMHVVWRVASKVNVNIFTGEKPISKMDACDVFAWALSAQNVGFISEIVDGEVRLILKDEGEVR